MTTAGDAERPQMAGGRDLVPSPALDGVRGLAILAVLATHVVFLDEGSDRFALGGGFLGVDIFIVLSAFLIASMLLREVADTSTVDGRGFARRRARRLYPPLVLLLAIEGPIAIMFGESLLEQARQTVLALSFTANWQFSFGHRPPFALLHLWSLSVEAQFYLLMAVGLYVARRHLRRPSRVVALLLLGSLAVAFWRFWLYRRGVDLDALYERTDTRADSMFLGVAAAMMWRHRLFTDRTIGIIGTLAAGFLAISLLVARPDSPWLYEGGFTVIAAASAALVAAVATGHGWLSSSSALPALRWVGAMSYSLYLWHLPIYIWVVEVAPDAPLAIKLTTALVGSFLAGWLSFRLVESRVLPAWRRSL